jgi:DNA replication protein DnaC
MSEDNTNTPPPSPAPFVRVPLLGSAGLRTASPEEVERYEREMHLEKAARCMKDAGIPACYSDPHLLATFQQHEGWNTQFKAAAAIVATRTPGKVIVLCGPRGSGKTVLGVEMLRHAAHAHLYFVVYTVLESYLRQIRGNDVNWEEIGSKFEYPKLLFIDEIAKSGDSAWQERQLFHLVNQRLSENRHTILAAACAPADLGDILGPSVLDRINEGGAVLHMNWPSFRSRTAGGTA